MTIIYTLFFLILTVCILTHSQISLYYAFSGLEIWYGKMIPALLPFMILSGMMIRMRLTEGFTTLVYPLVRPLYHVSRNVCYAMLMGFLCGFPMGAKTVYDLLSHKMITRREAEYLLAFCNNIGPVYFCSFVLPLLGRELIAPYIMGMYGIPLLYGLLLRYTLFRDISKTETSVAVSTAFEADNLQVRALPMGLRLLDRMEESIHSAVESILTLGGYMILFNVLSLLPHILLGKPPLIIAPLLEISGGILMLEQKLPLYTLLLLTFGGFSCIAQTHSCIRDTGLSIGDYILHKLILTALTGGYYLLWLLLFPASFLR